MCVRWLLTIGFLVFFPVIVLGLAFFAGFALGCEATKKLFTRTCRKLGKLCDDIGKIKFKNKCLKWLGAPFLTFVLIPMLALYFAWLLFLVALFLTISLVIAAVIFSVFGTLGWLLMLFVFLQALCSWSGDRFYSRQKAKAMKAAAKQQQITSVD